MIFNMAGQSNEGITPSLQQKVATPTKSQQSVTPDAGYDGLSHVTVEAIPAQYNDTSAVNAGAGDVAAGKIIVDAAGNEVTGTATFGANLDAIEVYVADFNSTDDLTVTTGAVDRYARVVVS